MPKQTFFNLDVAKQKRLVDAAFHEFSRAPFDEVSITDLVQAAKIPRGSFYQYFYDKTDVYDYLIESKRQASIDDWFHALDEFQGDLFAAFKHYFGNLLTDAIMGTNAAFYKNVFLHMDYSRSKKLSDRFKHQNHPSRRPIDLPDNVDWQKLKIQGSEDYQLLMHILMGVFYQSVAHYYLKKQVEPDYDLAATKHQFYQIIEWLQFGAQKEKGM
ncbi:TetR/AcrR family transcriptional regulator [Agrilactobacillus fermenti]|uniref:TetR/AcrR family transcriptional regulator n=1 Tax=Agrilactobacillus fermenti TaxID=2586909 RepID=UPI003A5C5B85